MFGRLTTLWVDGSFDTFDPIDIVDNEYSRVNYEKVLNKLGAYEDAEEQGLLLRLPCKRGDDVYIIPSKVNYDLNVLSKHEENNRVHHQKVEKITFNRNGWYIECDKDVEYGTDRICIEQHFGITWFLDPTKAEQKLAEYKGE